jgi:hypothetical protein
MLTKSHPFKKVKSAMMTYAIGERKKDLSSLKKRMEKGRIKKVEAASRRFAVSVFSFQ